jgi:hypothetical protein
MTARERSELGALVRKRAKVAKDALAGETAAVRADVERQLAAVYRADDERWKRITAEAHAKIREFDAQIAQICRDEGIPDDWRPRLRLDWYGRGETSSTSRRAELRTVAMTRIDAVEKAARAEIERQSVEVQTDILAGGLETEAARAFLASMPTARQLMPPLLLSEIDEAVPILRQLGQGGER